MGVFDSLHDVSEKAVDSGNSFIRISKEYYKLKTFKIVAKSLSATTKLALIGGMFLLGFIFLLVAGTLWLGMTFNNYPLAFLITAMFLFLLGVIAFLLKRTIDKLIIRKISEDFFDQPKP